MTVILVLAMFATFAVLDYFIHHRRKEPVKTDTDAREEVSAPLAQVFHALTIDGYRIPEELRFHPGHTWAYEERQHLHRVGIDELVARMATPIEKIELPQPWPLDSPRAKGMVLLPQWTEVRHGFARGRRSRGSEPGSTQRPDSDP